MRALEATLADVVHRGGPDVAGERGLQAERELVDGRVDDAAVDEVANR